MWFDTHCHLYGIDEDPEVVMERARSAGVSDALVVGTDVATSERALELASSLPGVWAGAAIHPTEAKGWEESWGDEIEKLLTAPRVVAVGETGIDLYWDKSYLGDQQAAFLRHVDLAKRYDKALVIHTRDSIDVALESLEEADPPARLVFHCWSGSLEDARRALALGAFISFAGNVSFRSAQNLRAVAAEVPADRLLVETDAPYLAPVPHRGKPNEPAHVIHVGAAVAEARGGSVESVATATTSNAKRLFAIDP